MNTPSDICKTPKITAIFILREFMNYNSFLAVYQMGSIPTGYIHSV
jgi:hypothetical protein